MSNAVQKFGRIGFAVFAAGLALTTNAGEASAWSDHDPPPGLSGFGGECARRAIQNNEEISSTCAANLARRLGYSNMKDRGKPGVVVFSGVNRNGQEACAQVTFDQTQKQWKAHVVDCTKR
jgi:hypothetical protein